MVLRKIGSGVTDANGVAVMTKNAVGTTISHSYTGSGAGKINLVAKPAAYDSVTLTVNPRRINDTGGAYSLSATLLNGGAGVSGEVVTFELRKVSDDSLVDTLTGTTNSSGIATVSYSGQGAGPLNIKVNCMSQSNTCEVTDCIFYDDGTTDKSSNWNTLDSITYNSDGNAVTLNNETAGTHFSVATTSLSSDNDYCVEIDVKNDNCSDLRIVLKGNPLYNIQNDLTTSDFTNIKIYTSSSDNKVYKVVNGVTTSVTMSYNSNNVSIRLAASAKILFKNLKIYLI